LGIEASELAIIVNTADNQSVEVANYYKLKRSIPESNIIRIQIPIADDLSVANFNTSYEAILQATPANIKAYVITWTRPWRVGGKMSITSAITFGYDTKWGGWTGSCSKKAISPFYKSYGNPNIIDYNQFYHVQNGVFLNYPGKGGRPSIALAGVNKQQVFDLIDRGVASDGTMPPGSAYLMQTTDTRRTVRDVDFSYFNDVWNGNAGFKTNYIPLLESTYGIIWNKTDVLFYLT
jgi:uncharacterized protein (TIGR03790 family)